jgi:hypothetical protein
MKNKKMTREEIATQEIGNTDISKTNQKILLAFFLILMSSAAVIQLTFNTNEAVAANVTMKNNQKVDESVSFL